MYYLNNKHNYPIPKWSSLAMPPFKNDGGTDNYDEYGYDANGNMVRDDNRGIVHVDQPYKGIS